VWQLVDFSYMNTRLSFCGDQELMQSLKEAFVRNGLQIESRDIVKASQPSESKDIIKSSRPSRKRPEVAMTAWAAIGKAADAAKAFFEILADKYPSGTLSLNIGKKIVHISKSDSPDKLEHVFEEQTGLQIDLKIDP